MVACRCIRSRLRREKLIERVKHGTVCMYSELEGIVGSGIPALLAPEMPHVLEEGEEDDESQCSVTRGSVRSSCRNAETVQHTRHSIFYGSLLPLFPVVCILNHQHAVRKGKRRLW